MAVGIRRSRGEGGEYGVGYQECIEEQWRVRVESGREENGDAVEEDIGCAGGGRIRGEEFLSSLENRPQQQSRL